MELRDKRKLIERLILDHFDEYYLKVQFRLQGITYYIKVWKINDLKAT